MKKPSFIWNHFRWSPEDVHVQDMSLQDYIAVKEKGARYLPHSAARYASKRFKKAQCPIVERMVNSLMMHGRNNGKKLMTVRIVKHSFEIIHLTTGENPLQVLIFQFLFKLLYFYPSVHFFLWFNRLFVYLPINSYQTCLFLNILGEIWLLIIGENWI